ncbi:hypothetical protein [Sulfurospirillum sp. hDNRA2]|uniref:hypothetical protein n=1 Tax=Sulfurospirillum sp. hDNRA2 TaxID=3237298 RepID=UPI0020B7498D|nr:hypothetical protein [Sulfurospirillum sp. DNRA8]MCP3652796.1 hypothetical protein [Sulfurospirillum sp. DNRA8]MCR1811648.1 hypothetical protein [Sulfurospirillum sp. DNRA8]
MLKILQWIIGGFACILLINLVWTVSSLDHSIMYLVSSSLDNNASETIKDFKDSWAIRGQMGDILSGHFSALAFLAVAFSIILQNEANRKMQMSIEKQDKALEQQEKSLQQQSKALEVQSESLKAQIEELQQSRKESEKQTEEFFIANMNVKLDRYYSILDEKIKIVTEDLLEKYKFAKDHLFLEPIEGQDRYFTVEVPLREVVRVLGFIYDEIQAVEQQYPSGYILFLKELKLRMKSSLIFSRIYTEFEGAKNSKAFSLLRD